MPDATDSLLRTANWEAEKLLRKRGQFGSVLFVAEYADGRRQRLERWCNNAPASVSDAVVLIELARDVVRDFAEANVVRFACAYLCRRTITLPIDPDATMKPSTTKKQGVCIELHSADEPVGIFREILRSTGGRAVFGAADGSPYASVLAESKAAAAVDKRIVARRPVLPAADPGDVVKVEAAAKAVDASSSSSVWPPRFLLRQPMTPSSIQPGGNHGRPGRL
jgi:hypothetical protein